MAITFAVHFYRATPIYTAKSKYGVKFICVANGFSQLKTISIMFAGSERISGKSLKWNVSRFITMNIAAHIQYGIKILRRREI